MYFSKFPKTEYEFTEDRFKVCVDILKRVGLTESVTTNSRYWQEHDLKDGETPESLAKKLYGDSQKSWLLLLTNEILNANYEWPLDQNSLYNRIIKKYSDVVGLYGKQSNKLSPWPSPGDIVGYSSTFGSDPQEGLSAMDIRAKVIASELSKGYIGISKSSIISATGNISSFPTVVNESDNFLPLYGWSEVEQKWSPKVFSYKRKIEEMHLGLHHFEDANGNWVSYHTLVADSTRLIDLYKELDQGWQTIADSGYTIVTNYDYEERKNESYRKIKVLKPVVQRNVEELIKSTINEQ